MGRDCVNGIADGCSISVTLTLTLNNECNDEVATSLFSMGENMFPNAAKLKLGELSRKVKRNRIAPVNPRQDMIW